MPANSKRELLEITSKEFDRLQRAIEGIDDRAAHTTDDDDTTIKDVVAHRAHWIELFLGWHRDGVAGREVFFPAEGYKWNELRRYNADLREQQHDLAWAAARSMLAEAHRTLLAFIERRSESELYGGPMAGAKNDWTTGRWAEAAGTSHYRSATKYVRARSKRLQPTDRSPAPGPASTSASTEL